MIALRLALVLTLLPLPAAAASAKNVKLVITPAAKTSAVLGAPWAALRSPRMIAAADLKLPPRLNIPLIAAMNVVSPVKQPPVIASLHSLSKLQDGPLRTLSFAVWDGGEEKPEGNEEYAYREQKSEKKKEERRMERSMVDYRPIGFYNGGAEEFLAGAFDVGAERAWTGRELLALLLTPYAIVDGLAPDPERVDMALFGKSDAALREILAAHGIDPIRFHETLNEAFNLGLIYRLNVAAHKKTYYGVPHPARKSLGVEAPEPPMEVSAKKDAAAFVASLLALAAASEARAGDDELFEFAAQAVHSAVAEGVLARDQVPAELREKLDEVPSDGEKLSHALLTFLESAQYTGLQDEAEAACRAAVAAGLLDEAEFDKALRGR